jgi:hypothetical protein
MHNCNNKQMRNCNNKQMLKGSNALMHKRTKAHNSTKRLKCAHPQRHTKQHRRTSAEARMPTHARVLEHAFTYRAVHARIPARMGWVRCAMCMSPPLLRHAMNDMYTHVHACTFLRRHLHACTCMRIVPTQRMQPCSHAHTLAPIAL